MSKVILIVDDAISIRGLVAMTLRGAGYEVVEASDGKDALAKLSGSARIDMILTDLNMPNLDGLGLIKAVKAMPKFKFLPMVMLTTDSQEDKKQEGRQAGAKAWVVKPFQPKTLVAVVKKILG